jgi:hypothetical protein
MRPEPSEVAKRLGFGEITIARLEGRGRLSRLALTEAEIRERLYHAHLAHLLLPAGGNRGRSHSAGGRIRTFVG